MGENLGPTKTWKITYYPKKLKGGIMEVHLLKLTHTIGLCTHSSCFMLVSILRFTDVRNYGSIVHLSR